MTLELALPSGTVTFLFTDIEGSTRLWEEHPASMRGSLERHDEILRSTIESHRGYVFSTAGDSFAASFASAGDAVAAAEKSQTALESEVWPASTPIRVRMGLHAGVAQERGGDYFGAVVNRAARIMSAGHGGQVLVSAGVESLVDDAVLNDLGEHRLKDLGALQQLYQLGSRGFPVLRTLDAVRHNLPVERTPLVGRKAEIVEYSKLLEDHHLVTLLGIGGTGKTRLATAVAAEVADRFADGVWFVDLIPTTGLSEVTEAILGAAGLQVEGTDLVDGLAELLSTRRLLLVLDNCEHLVDDVADLVDELLERCPGVRFLATSREPLQLSDERQVHVPPMEVGEDLSSPSLQLFAGAADRVGVSLGQEDVHLAARVCQHLDGLPLSLELAAAQLRQLSLAELADRLDQRFDLLTRGRPSRRRRQDSLIAVLQDTWEMLSPEQRQLLLQLAAFPAGFGADDIDAITNGLDVGMATGTLAGLVDHGVVARNPDGRHHLLETVRLFTEQRWAEQEDPDEFEERHTQWLLDHFRSQSSETRHTSFSLASWATNHYEDYRSVEDRLAATGRTTELATLINGLATALQTEAGPRASAAIDRIDTYLNELDFDTVEQAVLHLGAANAGITARRPERTTSGGVAAVEGLRPSDRKEDLAAALIIASWASAFRDLPTALHTLEEARGVAEAASAHAIADVALSYKAIFLGLHGRIDEAREILSELRSRIKDRSFDYSWNNYYILTLAIEATTNPAIATEAAAALNANYTDVLGGDPKWGMYLLESAAAGAAGDIDATRVGLVNAVAAITETSNDDGLPDLLIPPAALAWKLGDEARSRRWLTTIRRYQRPTENFQATIIYRQLRDLVGLNDDNPLDEQEGQDILQEATTWLNGLQHQRDADQQD